jgi:hypothetical protein
MAPPEKVAERKDRSHTARVLAAFLAERSVDGTHREAAA